MREPALKVKVRPGQRILAADQTNELDVLIEISATTVGTRVEARRLNVGFAIDRSGSMAGGRLGAVKRGLRSFIHALRPTDRVAVVTYGDYIESVVRSSEAKDRDRILEWLDPVQPGGCTAMHPGWVAAGLEVSEYYTRDSLNRVILVSDGMANVGETRPETTVTHAGELAARGVSTSTIGVGNQFADHVLIPMAAAGRGNAHYVRLADEFGEALNEELAAMRTLVSEHVRLRLKLQHAELLEILNDLEVEADGSVVLPPLTGHRPYRVLCRVRLAPGAENTVAIPVEAHVDALDYDTGATIHADHRAMVHFAAPTVAAGLTVDPDVTLVHRRLTLARVVRRCAQLLDHGRFEEAQALIDATLRQRASDVRDPELDRLARIAERLDDQQELERNRKHLRFTALHLGQSQPSGGTR